MGNEVGFVAMSDNSRAIGLVVINGKFKSLVMNKVKANLAKVIKELQINVLEIDEYLEVLSERLRLELNESLDEYGLTLPEFYITNVATPDDDPNFKKLKQQFADKTLKVRDEQIRLAEVEAAHSRKIMEAQTQAQVKMVGAQGDAEALKIKAMAEADAYKAKAMAEAEEMKAKGYTYQQETARKISMEAMQKGNGKGSGIASEMIGLGVTLGAMSGVADMTKNSIKGASEVAVTDAGWDCACGEKGITSKFCPECGAKKPEKGTWDCACGEKGITSKFCPECGAKKPEKTTWDCACGAKGITSKFCPDCGAKKN
jgi:membrane protease subunit (stomatin/prohibitin family)